MVERVYGFTVSVCVCVIKWSKTIRLDCRASVGSGREYLVILTN